MNRDDIPLNVPDAFVNVATPLLAVGWPEPDARALASAVHGAGRRQSCPLLMLHCARLPEQVIESELFGHASGSFPHAYRDKPGLFELAAGGTLFVDGLEWLTTRLIQRFARALATGVTERIGEGGLERRYDVRVIAAIARQPPVAEAPALAALCAQFQALVAGNSAAHAP